MTEHDFRRIALGMQDAIEGAHMGHPDFRVHGKIFATLHHERLKAGRGPVAGMVVLTPEQQRQFMRDHPASFTPESGAWGRSGCTRVQLDAVDEDTLGDAVTLAWQNTVQKQTAKKPKTARTKPIATKGLEKPSSTPSKAARSARAARPARRRS